MLQKEQSNQWSKPNNEQQSTIYSASSATTSSDSKETVNLSQQWPEKELLSTRSSSAASTSSLSEAQDDTQYGKAFKDSSASSASVDSSAKTSNYDQQQELAAQELTQNLQKEQSAIYSASSASASSKSESDVIFDSPTNWPQKESSSSKSTSSASSSSSSELILPKSLVVQESVKTASSAAASSDTKETVNLSQQWPEKELLSTRSSSSASASASSEAEIDTPFGKVLKDSSSSSASAESSVGVLNYDQQELAARALAQNLQKEQSNQWNKPNTDQQSAIYSSSSASASSTSESGVTFDSPTNWPQKELISSKSSSSASASASLEAEMDTPFGKVLKDSSSSSASAAASVGVLSYDQQQELAAQALAQNFQNKMSNQNGMGNIPNNQQPFTSYSSASSASASAKSESDVTFDSPNNWPQKELLSSKASSSAAASSSSKAESQFPFWRESVSLPESAERLSTNQAQFLAALEYSELLKKAQSTASSSAEVGLTPLIFAQKDASASSSSAVLLDKFDINQQQTPSSAISSSQDSPSSAASHSESLQSPLTLSQILKGQFASSGESQSTNNQRKQLETFGQSPFNPSRSASSPKVNVQGNQDDSSSQAAQRRSQDQKQVNLSQSESTSSSSSSSSSSSQIQSVLTADQPQAIESSKSKINSKQSEQDETLALEKKLNNQQLESSSSAEAKYRIKSAHEGQATTHHRTSQSLMNLLNALRNQLKVTNQQLTGDQTEDLIILQLRREISQSSTIEQLQRIYRIMIIQPPEIQQAIKLQMILKAVQLQQSHNEQSTAEEIDSVQRLILSLIEHDEFMEHGTGLLEEITSGVESVVSDIIG
ncbi:pneumococcal serine-rich repeat protein-like [Panonychus citri]|uniref:pneumococcal serine-rich repeat protein-like n=1 Tax=Panonychus citri TaxID=50023 RepID=UPI002307A169|nr:pneumococcal serine-rich repeat protein-like [Panonychus citri]